MFYSLDDIEFLINWFQATGLSRTAAKEEAFKVIYSHLENLTFDDDDLVSDYLSNIVWH